MDRRTFFVSLSAGLVSSVSVARAFAQSTPETNASDLEDLTQSEAMYAGILATWYEMALDSVDRVGALLADPSLGSDRWMQSVRTNVNLDLQSPIYHASSPPPARFASRFSSQA